MATLIPDNAASFTLSEIVAATNGTLVSGDPSARIVGVSTDTRTVQPENAFVALRGVRDGHEFVEQAIAKGASCAIVERDVPHGKSALIRVADGTKALGLLGLAHRRRWGASGKKTLVAITGSAGKTTTRRAVATVLASLGARVHASEGNLNNAIGIPMVLFGLNPEKHDTAVVEIGTNSPGEIAWGAKIAEPDAGLVTLVAAAHTEGLGTLDDVGREKGALLEALPESGIALANADDPRASAAIGRSRARFSVRYGRGRDADVRVVERTSRGASGATMTVAIGERLRERGVPTGVLSVETPLLGVAGEYATAAAIAVACALRPNDATAERLASAVHGIAPESGRLAPVELGDGTLLLDDSYNANGASVVASIGAAAEIAAHARRRLVLVLGEMRELGALSAEEHDRVGGAAAEAGPAFVLAVAGDAKRIADKARASGLEALFANSASDAVPIAKARVRPGDVVLVKGSRGVGLEVVVRAIAESTGGARR